MPPDLWEREELRVALAVRPPDIRTVFKTVRKYTGASQTTVGALVGLAQSDVSEIERGEREVQTFEVLDRIAAGLNIPPDLLHSSPDTSFTQPDAAERFSAVARTTATRVRTGPEQALEDDVRRRKLMTGALGLSLGILANPTAASAATGAPTGALELSLFEPAPAEPVTVRDLTVALAHARAAFTDAHYAALGQALPGLIAAAEATRDASSGRQREYAHACVARSYILATELAVKEHSEAAWVTADRSLTAARSSGDAQVVSEAARVVAITMRRAGRSRAAVDFLHRTALSVTENPRTPDASALAAQTCLLLTAAYTAACGRQRGEALDLLDHAEETAGRIPAGHPQLGLLTIAASPAECAMYRISVHNALGTPDEAVGAARTITAEQLSSTERVARWMTETTRMWHKMGDDQRAYAGLRALDRVAPEELRRPAMKAFTADMLYSPQHLPGFKDFAIRTGAVAA
ncbi:helix-turn-helix domain-containing protein [Streptomyces sp. NBC_01304]|uniref:helix-turn-helix domain-containing protein n=1 Tax=Streptomyces sp. NBC_01304 TaxID=2903818 RepID=UPI002E15782D|nr:helix-turn-helix domain-containing protein [Streptomyces sp. NBC_01304]